MRLVTALAGSVVALVALAGVAFLYGPLSSSPGGTSSTTTYDSTGNSSSYLQNSTSTHGGVVESNFSMVYGAFYSSPQHDIYRAASLWWVFYNNNTDVVFRTSSDGSSWSSPAFVRQGTSGFSTWVSGSTVYYAASQGPGSFNGNTSHPTFAYRFGTLSPAGRINWTIPEINVPTAHPAGYGIWMAVDGQGRVWAAAQTFGNTTSLEVYRNSGNTTPWVLTKVVAGGYETGYGALVPLSSGMALLYGGAPNTCCPNSRIYITTTTDGGSTWSSPVSPPSPDYYMPYTSAVSVGDTIYAVSPELSSSSLLFWSYPLGSNSTSPERAVTTMPVTDSLSVSGGDLVVTYAKNGSVYAAVSSDLGATWSAPRVLSTNELYANSMTSTLTGDFAVLWSRELWNGTQQAGSFAVFYASQASDLS